MRRASPLLAGRSPALARVEHLPGGRTRVALAGELDIAAAARLQSTLEDQARVSRELTLELDAVTFVDSSGLRAILACHRACREAACTLTLRHPPVQMHALLLRAGLLDRLTVVLAPPARHEAPRTGPSAGAA
jgi:anti-anti-sigma factor